MPTYYVMDLGPGMETVAREMPQPKRSPALADRRRTGRLFPREYLQAPVPKERLAGATASKYRPAFQQGD
jgi:hypothetical protein